MRLLIALLVLVTALHMPATQAQTASSPGVVSFDPSRSACGRDDPVCVDWVGFRRAIPGPYQAFAVAWRGGDRATVVISEPLADRTDLAAVVEAAFGRSLIARSHRRWITGLDGWLEDLVLDVRVEGRSTASVLSGHNLQKWEAPAGVVDRLLFLYKALHGTSDGFYVDQISGMSAGRLVAPIPDLTPAPGHLRSWFDDNTKDWLDLGGDAAAPVKLAAIQAASRPSVYARTDHSFVTLAVPPKTALSELAVPFRRFAVASDLLLAAFRTTKGTMLLIGRTRQLPMTVLPPLRFETLSSFIRFRSTELSQSYERQRIFAGRIQAGEFAGWDWAPILLSAQLDDSEFGTLLNLADQILKSWSQAGTVDYYAFAHPKPRRFPFGNEAASDYFAGELGTTSLVFNWNTENFTTIYQVNGGELLTVDRYGALPILYIPSGSLFASRDDSPGAPDSLRMPNEQLRERSDRVSKEAAEEARDYFARQGEPILVRVAQNVLLYQAATGYLSGLAAPATPKPARWSAVSDVLRGEATRWLQEVAARGSTLGISRETEMAVERLTQQTTFTIPQLAELIATPQATAGRLASSRARYVRLFDEAMRLDVQHDAASLTYAAAWDRACSSVSGTRTTRKEIDPVSKKPVSRVYCEYTTSGKQTPQAFVAIEPLERAMDELDRAYTAAEKELKQAAVDYKRLTTAYEGADALAKTLAQQASFVTALDRVLERVRTGVPVASEGSIRTPVVVLSRNTEDVTAIGGHNIDFNPARVRVASAGTAPHTTTVSGKRVAVVPQERFAPPTELAPDVTAALRTTRSGSLLEEMRVVVNRPIGESTRAAALTRASSCNCPLVQLLLDGQILLASPTPPPAVRALAGETAIVDALAGPPAARQVMFAGFGASTVENIVRSVQLATRNARPGGLKQAADVARRLFGLPESAAGEPWHAYLRRGTAGRHYSILSATDLTSSMRQPMSWRAAQVAASDASAVGALVRFPRGNGVATIESIAIAVDAPGLGHASATATLRNTVTATLKGPTPVRAPLEDGLDDLHRAITQRMTSAEVSFVINRNRGGVRVVEFVGPRRLQEAE